MVKVALFLEGKILSERNIDITQLPFGNPGIGGTEYLFLLLAYLLTRRDNGIDVTLFIEFTPIKPLENVNSLMVKDFYDAVEIADNNHFDYLVYRSQELTDERRKAAYGIIHHGLNLIMWCHNFLRPCDLDFYTNAKRLKALICVGKEQRDVLCDHPLYEKMSYIYNCVDTSKSDYAIEQQVPFRERKHIVTYIGSLVPMKSFHALAYAWPKVLKAVPDAELHVIGSGALYQSRVKLGGRGLAKWDYEAYFLKPLSKGKKLLSGVCFHGLMGKEKNEILAKTKVGVPNPLGTGETFCLSAVEMQLMGAKIAAMECCGYKDTVYDGILCKNRGQLAKCIIKALLADSFDHEGVKQYVSKNFSQSQFVEKWEGLLTNGYVLNDNGMENNFRHKKFKIHLCKLKKKYSFLRFIPALEVVKNNFDQLVLKKLYFRIPSRRFDQIDWVN